MITWRPGTVSGCQAGIVVAACQPECESEYDMYRTSSTAASDTQSESGKLRVLTRSRGPRIYMIPGHGIERGQDSECYGIT